MTEDKSTSEAPTASPKDFRENKSVTTPVNAPGGTVDHTAEPKLVTGGGEKSG